MKIELINDKRLLNHRLVSRILFLLIIASQFFIPYQISKNYHNESLLYRKTYYYLFFIKYNGNVLLWNIASLIFIFLILYFFCIWYEKNYFEIMTFLLIPLLISPYLFLNKSFNAIIPWDNYSHGTFTVLPGFYLLLFGLLINAFVFILPIILNYKKTDKFLNTPIERTDPSITRTTIKMLIGLILISLAPMFVTVSLVQSLDLFHFFSNNVMRNYANITYITAYYPISVFNVYNETYSTLFIQLLTEGLVLYIIFYCFELINSENHRMNIILKSMLFISIILVIRIIYFSSLDIVGIKIYPSITPIYKLKINYDMLPISIFLYPWMLVPFFMVSKRTKEPKLVVDGLIIFLIIMVITVSITFLQIILPIQFLGYSSFDYYSYMKLRPTLIIFSLPLVGYVILKEFNRI